MRVVEWKYMLFISTHGLTHLPLNKMAPIYADDIFKCIFMNEKFSSLIQISMKFVRKGPIDNKAVLVQVIACRLLDAKPLP